MSEETLFFKLERVNGGKALVKMVKGDDETFVPAMPGTKRFLAKSRSMRLLLSCCDESVLKFDLRDGVADALRAVRALGHTGIQVIA
jgi:hypothetical protein